MDKLVGSLTVAIQWAKELNEVSSSLFEGSSAFLYFPGTDLDNHNLFNLANFWKLFY